MRARRRWAWLASCLLGLPLVVGPAPGRAAAAAGPVVGRTVTSFRLSSADAGRAIVLEGDGSRLLAGAAGGDFGLVKLTAGGLRDWTFGGDGLVTTDFAGRQDAANGLALGPGSAVAAVGSSGGDVAVARYDRYAWPDRTFGTNGRVILDLGRPDDAAYAGLAPPDGTTVVVGGNGTAMVVARLRPDGSPDPAFGSGGRVVVPFEGPARAVAAQPDGSLVVTGGGPAGVGLARITPAGTLDPLFGSGGVSRLPFGAAAANAVGLLPDGRIVVAGGQGGDVMLARVLPTGQADPSFGTGGVALADLGRNETAYGLSVDGDGRARVVGEATDGSGFFATHLPSGEVDTTFATLFGNNGFRRTERLRAVVPHPDGGWSAAGTVVDNFFVGRYGSNGAVSPGDWPGIDYGEPREKATDAVRQPDGRVVVVGATSGSTGLVRHLPDGSRDASFGLGGRVVTDLAMAPTAVGLQPDGRIVVVASAPGGMALVGYRPDGSLDATFGTGGVATVAIGSPGGGAAMAVLGDGRLLVSGENQETTFLARFLPDGRVDPTFGTGGIAFGAFGSTRALLGTLVVQPDGKVLTTKWSPPSIVRANADGTPDRGFGAGGAVAFTSVEFTPNVFGLAEAITLQPDGRILVGGSTTSGLFSYAFSTVRLNPDGSRDGSWSHTITEFEGGTRAPGLDRVAGLFVDPDGGVLAVGDSAMARYRRDGSLDEQFAIQGKMRLGQETDDAVRVFRVQEHVVVAGSERRGPHGFVLATNRLPVPGQFQVPRPRAVAGNKGVTVSWTPPPGDAANPVVSYTVTRPDGTEVVTIKDGSARQFHVTGLTNGTGYAFAVRAGFSNGSGPLSAPSPLAVPVGRIRAWGLGGLGALGTGSVANAYGPTVVPDLVNWTTVGAGLAHSLAVAPDGRVWSWGWNAFGQLGDGTTVQRNAPVPVPGLTDVTAVSGGNLHSLALRADGTVWAWGLNHVGQLGDGTTVERRTPVRVRGLTNVKAVAAGGYHSLAVTGDGRVWAWGWNHFGQLGDGTASDRHTPTVVPGLGDVSTVAAGGFHNLALTTGGGVWGWGFNVLGQVGDGSPWQEQRSAVPVSRLHAGVSSIAAGAYHSVAGSGSDVWTWGWNGFGQLGDSSEGRWTPGRPPGNFADSDATVSAGLYHSVALAGNGEVTAWGWNAYGQLGDGSTIDRPGPVTVLPPLSTTRIAAGGVHTLTA